MPVTMVMSTIISVTVVIAVAPIWSVVAIVIARVSVTISISIPIIGAPIIVWTRSVVGWPIENRNREW
jgi:hypothetical protein